MVTYDNAMDLEEEDLPSQRSGLHAQLENNQASQQTRHSNCTEEYWLHICKNKKAFCDKCQDYRIDHPFEKDTTRKQFAELLATNFQREADRRKATMENQEVADDDTENNKQAQVTFLRRMVPCWYMKPLTSKTGGAMNKGSANEGQVIKVLPRYVSEFSQGEYKIKKVREYGLLTINKT